MQAAVNRLLFRVSDCPNGKIVVSGDTDFHHQFLKGLRIGKYVKKSGGYVMPANPHKVFFSIVFISQKAQLVKKFGSAPSEELQLHRRERGKYIVTGGSLEEQIRLHQLGCALHENISIQGKVQSGWGFAESMRARVQESLPGLSVVGESSEATGPAVVTLPSSAEKKQGKRMLTRQMTRGLSEGGNGGKEGGSVIGEDGKKKRQRRLA